MDDNQIILLGLGSPLGSGTLVMFMWEIDFSSKNINKPILGAL